MINVDDLCQQFQKALQMRCPYVSPGNTTMDTIYAGVDCSGLFVAAFKQLGGSIYHGSNTIYRSYLSQKGPLTSVKQLYKGAVVFKWQATGQPSKFSKDGIGNMCHIGLVVSTSPLFIIHASSAAGRVTCDSTIGKWKYCGKLKNVDYVSSVQNTLTKEEVNIEMNTGNVLTTLCGLNIRNGAGTSFKRIGGIAQGVTTNFSVVPQTNDWVRIQHNGVDGYICCQQGKNKYVQIISRATQPVFDAKVDVDEEPETNETMSISQWIQTLSNRLDELERKVNSIIR